MMRSLRGVVLCGVALAGVHLSALANITPEELTSVAEVVTISASPDDIIAYQLVRADAICNCYRSEWRLHDIRTGTDNLIDESDEIELQRERDGRNRGYIVSPSLLWSSDGTRLLYMRRWDGTLQAFIYDRESRVSSRVDTGESDIFEVAWAEGQDELLVTVGVESPGAIMWQNNGRRHGFRYDDAFLPLYQLEPLVSKLPPSSGALPDSSNHDRTTRQMLGVLKAVNLTSGARRDATDSEQEFFRRSQFASVISERALSLVSNRERNVTAYMESDGLEGLNLAMSRSLRIEKNGRALPCGQVCGAGVVDVFWNAKHGAFVFTRVDDGAREFRDVYLYSVAKRKIKRLARLSPGPSQAQRCAMTSDYLVCADEATTEPEYIKAIPVAGDQVRTLIDPNFGLRGKVKSRVERVVSDSSRGETAYGYLVYPSDYRPGVRYPLVIVSYICSGFLKGGVGNEYPIFPLAAEGMFVFCMSWPTREPDIWKAWEQERRAAGLPARYPSLSLETVASFVDKVVTELEQRGSVDRSKVAVTGLSAGAVFAAYSISQGVKYGAAILSSGAADPIDWYLQKGDWAASQAGHPFPKTNPDFLAADTELWNERSIARNAERIKVPLLINAADHEYLSALQTQAAYRHTGQPFELWVHTDEYHVKWQPSTKLAVYKRTIDWLGFWLSGRVGASPSHDPDQFERWHSMKARALSKGAS